jgi:phage gp37-like protein
VGEVEPRLSRSDFHFFTSSVMGTAARADRHEFFFQFASARRLASGGRFRRRAVVSTLEPRIRLGLRLPAAFNPLKDQSIDELLRMFVLFATHSRVLQNRGRAAPCGRRL